jgi:ferritin-like metal-binding protein YciE
MCAQGGCGKSKGGLFIWRRFQAAEYLPRAPLLNNGVTLSSEVHRTAVYWRYCTRRQTETILWLLESFTPHLPRRSNLSAGEKPMKMESLRELYVEELKDLYSAENQIIKALPKMIKGASSKALKSCFTEHLEQTKGHVQRLETIFKDLDESPKGKKCKGMEGVIADGAELLEEDAEPEVLDAGLIGAAQHVEHYEIAGYGCARTYADLLSENKAAKLLQQTLDEEKETDEKLTGLARKINVEAEKAA